MLYQSCYWVRSLNNHAGCLFDKSTVSAVVAPLFPSASEGNIQTTVACCPLSWISPTLWPLCGALKSQSRKTQALIRFDGSARQPDACWKTETSCFGRIRGAIHALQKYTAAAPAVKRDDWTDTRSISAAEVCSTIRSANICINHSISGSLFRWRLMSFWFASRAEKLAQRKFYIF